MRGFAQRGAAARGDVPMKSLLFLDGLCVGCRHYVRFGPMLIEGPGEPERALRKIRTACCKQPVEWFSALPLIWSDNVIPPVVCA